MELMKSRAFAPCAAILLVSPFLAGTVCAQETDREGARPAIGTEVFVSTDSDDTDITRLAVDFDLRNRGPNDRLGLRVEKAWYSPQGEETVDRDRIFLQLGEEIANWQLRARVGTDMHTIIGAISANDDAAFRKEVFLERDIVETPLGLDETPIYSTFGGAAIDVPVNDRNVINLLAGYQTFTGENERIHLRGTYIHVVKPDWGLSLQLRGRYFHSSEPREFDYYSPEYYAQVLPVVQVRRFFGDGWMVLGAGGIGVQRDSDSDWAQSNFGQLKVESPRGDRNWSVNGELIYTDTPSNSAAIGSGYNYFQALVGARRRF
ncbi:MAG: hypothetical protein WA957_17195 [Alteraurantiacibacter sp.]